MAYSRYSPARPSFDTLGSSVGAAPFPGAGSGVGAGSAFGVGGGAGYGSSYGAGTGNGYGYGNGYGNGVGLEDEMTRLDDEGETVESVMAKLAIERRVQYGAEKMLDVIEQRSGNENGDQEQVKERITAQLEASNESIKMLEARLERLKGSSTPHRRRRPAQMLHGYSSTSSLGQGMSSSLSSSNVNLVSAKPRPTRQLSNLTPDREPSAYPLPMSGQPTPVRSNGPLVSPRRQRSQSTGEESLEFGFGPSESRLGWIPTENENSTVILEAIDFQLRRLNELNGMHGKGKGRQKDGNGEAGDEAWRCLIRVGEMLKRAEGLRGAVDFEEIISAVIPYLVDSSSVRRRAAGYRVLRYTLTRQAWGAMIRSGLEWLIIRTFTRDSKAITEREQALRLLRAVMTLPPYTKGRSTSSHSRNGTNPGHSRNPSGGASTNSRQPSHQGHSRNPSYQSPVQSRHKRNPSSPQGLDPISLLLENRVPLTDGMVRGLVSCAENPDDPMRIVCLQTLIEIGMMDLRCLIQSDAFRTIILAIKDGPAELGPSMVGLFLYLANQPSTRQFLMPGSDLETVLVGLTEAYGKIPSRQQARYAEKLSCCVRDVGLLLSSWSGFLYLCMDDCRAIKSIIGAFYVPLIEVKRAILNLVISALRIKAPSWSDAFLEGKRLTVYNRTHQATSQLQGGEGETETPQSLTLVDHYVALVLAVFIENGLLEALVSVIEEDTTVVNRKATLLLGEVLQLANRILPSQFAAQLQALPRLFTCATEFGNPTEMHAALSALSSIDSLNRNQMQAAKQATKSHSRNGKNAQDSLQRGQRQVQQVKLRLGLQIEDKQFQQMIIDSGVLVGRDHTKWNYDIIMDLVEGPLLNSKRLDEAIKATKFIRRLASFFHPHNNRFSIIKRTRPNHKWVRLGKALLSTLLVNPEGLRFLNEDKLLPQMVECFNELDLHLGRFAVAPVFARDRVENSLTYGYFEMIGVLSAHQEGAKLLEKFKFLSCFYHLSEQRSRDDIIRIIIECFDYTFDGHPRIVLAKALTSAYMKETRLFATHHLGRLLQDVPSLMDWALQLMITQLYDTAMEVCDVAVMYLEEVCQDTTGLEKVVQLRPTLEHLGEIGGPLFMRFVSTSVGFRYLHQSQYIEREIANWLEERNLLYVIETETWVTKTLRPFTSDVVEDYWVYDGRAPTHFFGELTKTPEGCQLLREKGLVAEFAEIIRLHGMEPNDQSLLVNLRSMLWALGNIGSTEGGLPFLEDEEIIEVIIEIAERSPVLTVRGTCFFVIGLISSTRMGAEILEEYGWISTRTSLGLTTGLCIPNDISRFAHIEPWPRAEVASLTPPLPKLTGLEGEIMTFISNLANYVLAAGAMNNLKRLRVRHPRYFSSITLFHRALRTISTNHYQAPVRRFILDLFDISLESEVLTQLHHLELSSYKIPMTAARMKEEGGESDRETRRRSASSPGPEPPGRTVRARGLTISGMSGEGKGELEPRQQVRGFGVPA